MLGRLLGNILGVDKMTNNVYEGECCGATQKSLKERRDREKGVGGGGESDVTEQGRRGRGKLLACSLFTRGNYL